jgi:hypothetical protein
MMHSRFRSLVSLLSVLPLPVASAFVLGACGSTTTTVFTDAGAATAHGTYTLVFPSLSVAVAAQTVEVLVFPAADAKWQCPTLITAQTLGNLPTPIALATPASICGLADAGSFAGDLTVGFGSYAVLVVVQKNGAGVAIGCAEQTITAAEPNITVTLEQTAVPPPTTCSSLSAFCANGCPDGG